MSINEDDLGTKMDNKLQQLQQSFNQWRDGRKYPGSVPVILKEQVLAQLSYFSDMDIAIATGLARSTVSSWRQKKAATKSFATHHNEQQFVSIANNESHNVAGVAIDSNEFSNSGNSSELKMCLCGIELQFNNYPAEKIVQLLSLLIKQEVV